MSFTHLKYHITFSTKGRRPFITAQLLRRLCQYLGGMVKKQGGQPIEINGPEDHIHIVASLSPAISISECLQDLKANTTNWVHQTFPDLHNFFWQEGYSAFSVSPSVLPSVVNYVRNQQEHHKKVSFAEELKWLLDSHGIDYEERYL